MGWYVEANNKHIINKIKDILKNNNFVQKLLKTYDIPISDIDDNLNFEFKKLEGKFAEGNGHTITLDPDLFKNNDFFENQFHFVIHELFHWIKRRHEDNFYFNDKEEIQSFVLAIMWEFMNGKSKEDIKERIYPIIEVHFENEKQSIRAFEKMCNEALKLLNHYKKIK